MILRIPIDFKELVPVFIVASCAGIISMIPGGSGPLTYFSSGVLMF